MIMTLAALVNLIVMIAIVGGVCWLLWWLIGYINPPEPFNKVLRIIVAVIGVLFLINVLLGFAGTPIVQWK